jgi:hypothetical protein
VCLQAPITMWTRKNDQRHHLFASTHRSHPLAPHLPGATGTQQSTQMSIRYHSMTVLHQKRSILCANRKIVPDEASISGRRTVVVVLRSVISLVFSLPAFTLGRRHAFYSQLCHQQPKIFVSTMFVLRSCSLSFSRMTFFDSRMDF